MHLRLLLSILIALLFQQAAFAQPVPPCAQPREADRVALIIGNSDYSRGDWQSLGNAAKDAITLCETLARTGFRVELLVDADSAAMRAGLGRFAASASKADAAIVYFAGHGFEYLGTGYLVPVDGPAPPKVAPAEMVARFLPLDEFARAAARAKSHKFVFLDACRVPIGIADGGGYSGAFGTISKDLPPDFDWSGILIYSTSRNRYAYDAAPEDSPNSPFASAIASRMLQPGLGFASFLRAVRVDVEDKTQGMDKGAQLPTAWGIPGDEFKFVGEGAVAAPAPAPAPSAPVTAAAADAARPVAPIAPFAGLTVPMLGIIDEPMLIARLMRTHTTGEIIAHANKGDPVAQYLLGYMLHFGDNLSRDMNLARVWLEKAAASGHPAGQTELAYFLARNAPLGAPGEADRARSRELYEKAVAQGFPKAQSHFGHALLWGTVAPIDKPRALSLFEAAAKAGHVYATFALGSVAGGDAKAAEAWLREIVRDGNPEGNLWLCELFHALKRGGEAANECIDAASRGYSGARAITALLYDRGNGVTKSAESAEYWARLALKTPDLEYGYQAQMRSLLSGMQLKP